VKATSPWLESIFAAAAADIWLLVGVRFEVRGPLLQLDGARLELLASDACPGTSRSDETNSDETSATDAEDRPTADLVTSDGDIAELPSVPSTAGPAV